MYTSSQNLPSLFDNDDFQSYHPGKVVETRIAQLVLSFRPLCLMAVVMDFVLPGT